MIGKMALRINLYLSLKSISSDKSSYYRSYCADLLTSSCLSPSGQSVLSPEHRASAHHQAEGDPSGGVESLHESRESHPHPGASSGNSVRPASLQAGGTGLLGNIRLHHAHTDAFPGRCDGLSCTRIFCVI